MRQPIEWDADRWPNFRPEEGANPDWPQSGLAYVEPVLLDALQYLRDALSFPLPVASAYRSPIHNAAVSSTGVTGPHTTGLAVDIAVCGGRSGPLLEHALSCDLFTGIGIHQRGPWEKRFIHLDMIERPYLTIWSY